MPFHHPKPVRNALTLARLFVALAALVTLFTLAPTDPAGAAGGNRDGVVTVLKVSGLLDPINIDFVSSRLREADAGDDVAVVLQVNSEGAAAPADDVDALVELLGEVDVPVTVWVGPSGAKAEGAAARLVAAADISGIAPGSRVEVVPDLVDAARVRGGFEPDEDPLRGRSSVGEKVGRDLAVELRLVDNGEPTIGEFIVGIPGVETEPVTVETDDGDVTLLQPVTPVRFGQLDLVDQLFHTVASRPVAYLLFVIGGGLLVFELFTAGVGIAGVVGAGSFLLSSYGLGVLPTNTAAIVALGLCFVAFAIDVQTGVPRFWTGVGTLLLVYGSLTLFDGASLSWITLLAGIGGTLLAMIGGMPAMVRTRFSTPTIGRDWMIGETGTAVAAVSPDGVVTVRDAPWRAHTNRATPIEEGDEVRVVGIDGLVLEVEPLEGAAKDYRRG